MMEAVRTSETSDDNHFTRQYNPEDSSEHHTRRRENLKSHMSVSAGKDESVSAGRDESVSAGRDESVSAGKDESVSAGKEIPAFMEPKGSLSCSYEPPLHHIPSQLNSVLIRTLNRVTRGSKNQKIIYSEVLKQLYTSYYQHYIVLNIYICLDKHPVQLKECDCTISKI
jgi:hypothetical protein